MKVNKNKSKFSSALSYFVKKTTVGTLIGMVMLSSTLMVSPDLIAHANSSSGNDSSSNVVAYQQVADAVAKSPFKDVATNSYAFDAIVWGKNQGLINGYSDSKGKPNGKFGPNDNVTEAQFVKMVTNYLGIKDTAGNLSKNKGSGAHWSDSHYDAMAKHGVPLNGYFDNKVRNEAMKRGTVAQALGYLLGEGTNLKDSINFLLDAGVTSGQNPQYEGKDLFKYFGSNNNLTRAQVITFLYRMDNRNLNNLSSLADGTGSYKQDLNAKAKEGYSYVDTSLSGNKSTGNNTGSVTRPPITHTPKPVEKPNPPVENNNNDFSNAKLQVKEGTSTKKVNINTLNNVVSSMSNSTINKIKNNGYEVVATDSDYAVFMASSTNYINIYNKKSTHKGSLKYDKGTDSDLIVGLVKDLYGINIDKKHLFPSYENKTSKYLVEGSGSTYTIRIGDFR